jgi:hypothetical protein
MSNQIIANEFFISALSYAKALARRKKQTELSPDFFLAGAIASLRSGPSKTPTGLMELLPRAEAALKLTGIVIPKKIAPLVGVKFALGDQLKNCIAECNDDVEEFLKSLIALVAPNNPLDNFLVNLIMPYAQQMAQSLAAVEISAGVFAVAGYAAYRDGLFRDRPALSSYFSANSAFFEATEAKTGTWSDLGGQKVTSVLPLSQNLIDALQGEAESSAFISALNLGMKIGVDALSSERTAYHEAGHALVSAILRAGIPVKMVSIVPENDYIGVTVYDGSSPWVRRLRREDFLTRLCVALAGRAGEYIKFGPDQMDDGASSDLDSATSLAWESIAILGLDPEFGPINLAALSSNCGVSNGWLYDKAQQRLQEVLKQAAQKTEDLLLANWAQVEVVAAALLANGKIDYEQFVGGLVEQGLQQVPGAVKVRTLSVEREVHFEDKAGVVQTMEGAVRYDPGAAIVKGEHGEAWPVQRDVFERLYEPASGQMPGKPGRYRKRIKECYAVPLSANKRLDLSHGRGILAGASGDWVVDYGDNDLAIVANAAFTKAYEIV